MVWSGVAGNSDELHRLLPWRIWSFLCDVSRSGSWPIVGTVLGTRTTGCCTCSDGCWWWCMWLLYGCVDTCMPRACHDATVVAVHGRLTLCTLSAVWRKMRLIELTLGQLLSSQILWDSKMSRISQANKDGFSCLKRRIWWISIGDVSWKSWKRNCKVRKMPPCSDIYLQSSSYLHKRYSPVTVVVSLL